MTRSFFLTSLLVLLAATACGPIVMIPGGALSGPVTSVPRDWSFTDEIDTVQLETGPGDPYSVNVWGVAVGSRFYIAAGDSSSQWAKNALADPRVRLRIDGNVYEMDATPATEEADFEAFLAAAKAKYDFEPDPEQREKATLFRLEGRS